MEIWDKKELAGAEHLDLKNYRWKFFYYNKSDPRVFVPKRNPDLGSTVNFARRGAWLMFIPGFFFILILIVLALFNLL